MHIQYRTRLLIIIVGCDLNDEVSLLLQKTIEFIHDCKEDLCIVALWCHYFHFTPPSYLTILGGKKIDQRVMANLL